MRQINLFFAFCCIVFSCSNNSSEPEIKNPLQLSAIRLGSQNLDFTDASKNVNGAVDQPLVGAFSNALDQASVTKSVRLIDGGDTLKITIAYLDEGKTFSAKPEVPLAYGHTYTLLLKKTLRGANNSTFPGIVVTFSTEKGSIKIISLKINAQEVLTTTANVINVSRIFKAQAQFSSAINSASLSSSSVRLIGSNGAIAAISTSLSSDNTLLDIGSVQPLNGLTKYSLSFTTDLQGSKQEQLTAIGKDFYTEIDPTPKFPIISDNELLDLVQKQTLKYFYDFAHPTSGMARERNTSGNTVTSGGSGFGIMAIIVGMERNFISRTDGINHMKKMVTFLEKADRFHGAWSHWIDGSTGKVIPFSTKDNGGDLVETSFLVEGLITFRQYLQPADTVGNNLINRINKLWQGVEWDWYRKNNENVLYWHWSPNYNWDMNFAMYGYFEEQITYFLAAASPTHSIPKIVYTNGFGKNGSIVKNNTYYGYKLPLESPSPLFWVQYSYLGLDPHFSDGYANYWEQNVNATLINQAYCIANPKKFVGYSADCWGLTASDNQDGYNAHSPGNDLGVITPTAALSSFPYTPTESMKAMKFFYYTMGDKLWGQYGFYDAFNLTKGWTATSYLAIDQGPIVVMIENYRSKLLWNLFMSAPEVTAAKAKLGFTN